MREFVMRPFTEKMLIDWAGPKKFQEGKALFDRGTVEALEFEPPIVRGTINTGSRALRTAFRLLPDNTAESLCPCYDNRERGVICSHVIAIGLALHRRLNRPELLARQAEEDRRAAAMARRDEGAFLRRGRWGEAGAQNARIEVRLGEDWRAALPSGRVPLAAALRVNGHGVLPLDQPQAGVTYGLSETDENLLFVLEDIAGGPPPPRLEVGLADFFNLLSLLAGRSLGVEGGAAIPVAKEPAASRLSLDMEEATGELILTIRTAVPPASPPAAGVLYLVHRHDGWALMDGRLHRLSACLPEPLFGIYRCPMRIPRLAVPRFMRQEWPALQQRLPGDSALSLDLFTIEPADPVLRLRLRGSPASLSAHLFAEYDGVSLIAGKADPAGQFAIPDPDDLLRYTVRNPEREQAALEHLAGLGLDGETGDRIRPLIGNREVMNFLARDYPALRRRGWKVEIQGRASEFLNQAAYVTPVVRIASAPSSGQGWFEVAFQFETTQGATLSAAAIQRALLKGDSFLETEAGCALFDAGAIEQMREVFEDCAAGEGREPGSFRLAPVHAAFVKASLDGLDGVDVEADAGWREVAARQLRGRAPEDEDLPAGQADFLRVYQRDGVRWLRFLEHCAFAGVLADEMGLGKTLQALVWLRLPRLLEEARGKPSLIVCPTSLVENWAEEAARFTPELKVRVVAGLDRHDRWEEWRQADVLVTSYALLRRDIERYAGMEFAVVLLDEAQHIKNRSTQNALAAKRLRAHHRLVLTGTPMENSVSDLWSILDFLMPGYLGRHEAFRRRYELPIAEGGPDGEAAQARLRRKLQPFLLRRLKRDVARELPPKIEKLATCALTPDQQQVYRQLLETSRERIRRSVEEKGFNASRMEVLRTLLRLRQVCCHLDLLKLRETASSPQPSAKLDLMAELLEEALDGGHRALIFSQFVSMLSILRAEFARRGWRYCYLDGSTQDRLAVVKQFNTDRRIPFFLISLKAGGTGLNLTGADMVVHFDPWWNPAVEDQATDRAYRIGQHRTVYSLKLIARDTVEEKVLALQRRKQALIDATVRAGGRALNTMDWDDVRELLDL